ncbi:response regulator transcription factor [Gimesia panareensis]|uniref:response regulator transcription factor n=1 Tax=Gimesia panareensis TaxID=2527978 RepID=UPI0011A5DCB1
MERIQRLPAYYHPCVFIIDDHADVRDSYVALLQSYGLHVEAFASAEDFLSSTAADSCGCVLTDFELTGCNGLELLKNMKATDCPPFWSQALWIQIPQAPRSRKEHSQFWRNPIRCNHCAKPSSLLSRTIHNSAPVSESRGSQQRSIIGITTQTRATRGIRRSAGLFILTSETSVKDALLHGKGQVHYPRWRKPDCFSGTKR